MDKFLTAEEITKWYGERCPDTEPGCPTCKAWVRHDILRQMEWEDICDRGDFIRDEDNANGWCCLEDESNATNTEEN